jgi:hypothetical protein
MNGCPRRYAVPAIAFEVMFGRIGDDGGQPTLGLGKPHLPERTPGQIHQRAAGVVRISAIKG